jgi:NADPH-dependent curcumin reductase CurA
VPTPEEGEVLMRYALSGAALAHVVESRATDFAPGGLVYADNGWQDYAVFPAERLRQAGTAEPLIYLSGAQ